MDDHTDQTRIIVVEHCFGVFMDTEFDVTDFFLPDHELQIGALR